AMQIAGSFFDQRLWFRKTQDNASQPWRELVSADAAGEVRLDGNLLLGRNLINLGTTSGGVAYVGEAVGGIGFMGYSAGHAQLSYRAGRGFELIDVSSNFPQIPYY